MYNDIVKKFFSIHKIKPEFIKENFDTTIKKSEYYLGALAKYAIYKPYYITYVSIGDIYGTDFNLGQDNESLFDLFNFYFWDEPKDKKSVFYNDKEHYNRSNQFLLLTIDEIIERCSSQFDLITVNRVDNEKNIYLIYTNGVHRFLVLKALYYKYISEFPDNVNDIKEKFKIKVKLSEMDEIKTFCCFILRNYYKKNNKGICYRLETKDYEYTGRIELAVGENKNYETFNIYNDDELTDLIKPLVLEDLEYYRSIEVESFQKFIDSLVDEKRLKKIKEEK